MPASPRPASRNKKDSGSFRRLYRSNFIFSKNRSPARMVQNLPDRHLPPLYRLPKARNQISAIPRISPVCFGRNRHLDLRAGRFFRIVPGRKIQYKDRRIQRQHYGSLILEIPDREVHKCDCRIRYPSIECRSRWFVRSFIGYGRSLDNSHGTSVCAAHGFDIGICRRRHDSTIIIVIVACRHNAAGSCKKGCHHPFIQKIAFHF